MNQLPLPSFEAISGLVLIISFFLKTCLYLELPARFHTLLQNGPITFLYKFAFICFQCRLLIQQTLWPEVW
jgi:hypothetical protein